MLASDAFRSATPYNAPFADSLDDLKDFYNIPEYAELLSVAIENLADALVDKKTPQAALDAIAKAHEDILREAGRLKE